MAGFTRKGILPYIGFLLVICLLYALNRFLLLPFLAQAAAGDMTAPGTAEMAGLGIETGAAGILYTFLSSFGADILAGAWILCFLDLLLTWSGRRPLAGILPVSAFLLACGVFWEGIAPLYLAKSVSDPLDILAYWAGGIIYFAVKKTVSRL